ncbi:hypothetical protein [Frigoriglobus tundricola]|uniref:Uncharacterized protein n=1 Tax=Frigoriglobus tundricola TaxID=2774151 RepID=A0A6M5YV31_9BACT|nr:hypothetical protein [Frigoriglobus tundricola]QJW97799.1 hypothetical protein FTUN_5379 [Frigoriglobus tundricola]
MSLSPLSPFRGWRAALLLAAAACATPGRATAECGDHVTILTPRANPSAPATPAPIEAPAPLKAPCSGPNCSRLPDRHAPPVAPAPVSEAFGKELAQLLGLFDPLDGVPAWRVPALSSSRPVSRAPSIFHPPRAA